jgi:hypothetical protein
MYSGKKLYSIENRILKRMQIVADLEGQYVDARKREIASGSYDPKRRFSESRGVLEGIRKQIRIVRAAQKEYNKTAKPEMMIQLVEEIIQNEPIFVQAREILEQIEVHSALTIEGLERSMGSFEYQNLPSKTLLGPPEISQREHEKYKDDKEVQALIKANLEKQRQEEARNAEEARRKALTTMTEGEERDE